MRGRNKSVYPHSECIPDFDGIEQGLVQTVAQLRHVIDTR
jgi:hypothetical protein